MRVACLQTPAFGLHEARTNAQFLLDAVDRALGASPMPDLLLLPEVAYPAYFLEGITSAIDLDERLLTMGAPSTGEFARLLGQKAREAEVNIAAGVALAGADGALRNMMILYDRQGQEILQAAKQYLWHFDACWFTPGDPPPVVAIDGIPAGLFVCCDGRASEIPRRLALAGAQLFLDSTNWVTSGRDPRNLPNAQPDYMMAVRAMENGCWFASANKVGREADSIVYCGKSCVIGPDGKVWAMASSYEPETIVVDIPQVPEGLEGAGTGGLVRRRGGEYRRLTEALVSPVTSGEGAPAPYVAAVQVPPEDSRLERLLADLVIHGARLAVLPEGERPLSYWQEISARVDLILVATGVGTSDRRTAWVLERGRVLGQYAKGHSSNETIRGGLESGWAEPLVIETSEGRIGLMIGEDGLLPEVALGLSLAGADLIAWPNRLTAPWVEGFARSRAAENRVFVVAVGQAEPGGEALVVDPAGVVLVRTFPGVRQAVGTYAILAVARHKSIVPGTVALGAPRYPELG